MLKHSTLVIITTTLLLVGSLFLSVYPLVAAFLGFLVAPVFIVWMALSILQPTGDKIPDLPDNGDPGYLDLPS